MIFIKEKGKGLLVCFGIAATALLLGQWVPVVGGPVFAILIEMLLAFRIREEEALQTGTIFTSKKILQYAAISLGFGLNPSVITKTGQQSLPIILTTITTSLVIAYGLKRRLHVPVNISTLVGVGSSICGDSAVTATAPVIAADNEEVAQTISVILLFNIPTTVLLPRLGTLLHFHDSEDFGVFAGTAMNDTSSVTAATATWDSMFRLNSATLDKTITIRLTRTLAIIPVTLPLGVQGMQREEQEEKREGKKLAWKQIFPVFILYFLMAPVVATTSTNVLHISPGIFLPLEELSKFFVIMAMEAVGLHADTIKLVKNGGKPIFMGFCCRVGITLIPLLMQRLLDIW